MCVGPRRPIETGLVVSVSPGSKSRAQAHQGSPGTWDALPFPSLYLLASWGEVPDPKLPGRKSASDLAGATKTGARVGHRHAKETKRDGTGGRESEHFIVPSNRENVTLRIPGREGGAGSGACWRETWRVHRNPIPCPQNNN